MRLDAFDTLKKIHDVIVLATSWQRVELRNKEILSETISMIEKDFTTT